MPNYRRAHVPGGTFFFTLVTHRRHPLFANPAAQKLLGCTLRRSKARWPFETSAIVLLPDRLHAIWTLPRGDSEYSNRWGWIKKEFTKFWLTISNIEQPVSEGRKRERRGGLWHEDDFERHFDYIHDNPVKHGYVRCPHEWDWSSFHRWVDRGVYRKDWACWNDGRQIDFSDIKDTTGEPETW